ncbi:MAG: HDIG domain-containing protein [Dehalococcoidia bacterium]|nr:HDIG domain-containing protein [Dehalococcoidia bacterium]
MRFFSQKKTSAIVASIAGFTIAVFAALLPVTPSGVQIEAGEIASRTIRAPRDISFVSPALTAQRQDEAAAAVQDSLLFDPSVASSQQSELNTLLSSIRGILNDTSLAENSRDAALERVEQLSLSDSSKDLLRNMDPAAFEPIETEARRALAAIFEQTLPAALVQETRERASTYVSPTIERDESTLISEVVRPFIVSNLAVDAGRTNIARDAARAGIAPVQVTFARNQVIVEQDAPVTGEAREALIEAGLVGSAWKLEIIAAGSLLALVVAVTVAAGLSAFRPDASVRQLFAIGIAIALPVFVMKIYLPLILPDNDRHFLTYVMPLAVSSMVLSGFVGAEIALLAATLIAFLAAFAGVLLLDVTVVGIAGTLDIARIALVTGIASAAGVFAVRNAERLAQFLVGGAVVGLSVLLVLGATWLIDPDRQMRDIPWILLAAGANGGLSAFLSAGIFVTLGALFGVTTRLQLLEMSQLSQPLLLRLQDEAPSTFQHSVIVANLAEKGAYVIGADALLARVGCYYHDIGKLARPGFFIENQLGGQNPHDALDPADSARIISDHVRDGLALAAQYKLPAKVSAFIPEHHGTRMVSYFYREAAADDPRVDPDAFRYPGPKPQTRETAIAMLADSSEAAVRSNPDHSPESIDKLVDDVFNERLSEGQLNESDLTLRNLRDLAESYKATLRAVYHPRIEYPAPTEAELLMRRLPFRASK